MKRPPAVRKALGAYYTPAALVRRALGLLPAPPAGARVVDLACGDGAWLADAGVRWPGAELLGVEIDPQAAEAAARRLGGRARIRLGDGLCAVETADLVIGNPPWG